MVLMIFASKYDELFGDRCICMGEKGWVEWSGVGIYKYGRGAAVMQNVRRGVEYSEYGGKIGGKYKVWKR